MLNYQRDPKGKSWIVDPPLWRNDHGNMDALKIKKVAGEDVPISSPPKSWRTFPHEALKLKKPRFTGNLSYGQWPKEIAGLLTWAISRSYTYTVTHLVMCWSLKKTSVEESSQKPERAAAWSREQNKKWFIVIKLQFSLNRLNSHPG